MQKIILKRFFILTVGLLLAAASTGWANNLRLANFSLVNTDTNAGSLDIQFDLSWENSWRASWEETDTGAGSLSVTNWDAAWVFIKYRLSGDSWDHVLLAPSGHSVPAGMALDLGQNEAGTNVGAFIYRSAEGHGTLNLSNVRLRWNYAEQGLLSTNELDISVHAIEMVYVPKGPFWVGGLETETNSLTDGSWTSGSPIPFRINSEAALTISNAAGCLWCISGTYIGTAGLLPEESPKGYNAFYCMKYLLTQGQYTDFLNELSYEQATNRFVGNTVIARQTIGVDGTGRYTNAASDRAANGLSINHNLAYLDWAGLRPITELEYEKACRGPKYPVANELAWGNASAIQITAFIGEDGSGVETASPANANSYHQKQAFAPARVGMFATPNSTRAQAGASYYGMLDMCTMLALPTLYLKNVNSRGFKGTHGDGALLATGDTDNSDWLNKGWFFKGGRTDWAAGAAAVAARYETTMPAPITGLRGVRSAP